VLFIIAAHQFSVLPHSSGLREPVYLKAPWEYRFPPRALAFSRSVSSRLQDRNLLAPQSIVVVLGLINPTVELEATRPKETLHVFGSAGQGQEGMRRIVAQSLVTTCARSPDVDAAFLRSVETGVDALILQGCTPELLSDLADLLAVAPGQWTEVEHSDGYVLLMRSFS
jgi:hypothetical protein